MAAVSGSPNPIPVSRSARRFVAVVALLAASVWVLPLHADEFTKPTAEELHMTSLPGYPGVAAVMLDYQQTSTDDLHVQQYYVRIKVLTEEGKKYANVELPFYNGSADADGDSIDNSMDGIQGRTIQPDGTIIPFTGKPYLKTIAKMGGNKAQERIFTLPDVQVGSIIEYRYNQRYSDSFFEPPDWSVQQELYVKSAHFTWYPTQQDITDGDSGKPITAISWFPILPKGVVVEHHDLARRDATGNQVKVFELSIKDVPPMDTESFMPPIKSFSYRVMFNFTPYINHMDYWNSEGKSWSKREDHFIGPDSDLRKATAAIIAGSTTDDQKLRKIYAAVMALDNTDFSREHDRQEDKAAGLGKINNTNDVLTHKRGNNAQITELFIGMARAAGMKAYLMNVTSRRSSLFMVMWQNIGQLNSTLAVVNVDGKEEYFDPGSRYCPYGRLDWGDTFASGIRQYAQGAEFGSTPGEQYKQNFIGRAGNLTIDDHGNVTGTIDVSMTGDAALFWRQRALRGDDDSIRHSLRTYMEDRLPKTVHVKISNIENMQNYEQPLHFQLTVTGTLGNVLGKRLILPADLFQAQAKATFPNPTRTQAVYFDYPDLIQEAVRVNFPANMTIEAAPSQAQLMMRKVGFYTMTITPASRNITIRRTYGFNDVLVDKDEYPDLRSFYSQLEAKDQDSIVLKQTATTASATPATVIAPAGK